MRECQIRFGFSRAAWRDAVERGVVVPRARTEPLEQLLVRGRARNRYHVKSRMLHADLKEHRCEE